MNFGDILKPVEKQIAKWAWEVVLHPLLLKQEALISSAQLKMVAAVIDTELDKVVEAEIAKLP